MIRTLKVAGLLAFTSIMRGNKGVVLLTILILTLVAMNLMFVPSLLDGLVEGANEKLIDTYVGDLVIEPDNEQRIIRNADDFIRKIEAIDGVKAVTSRNGIAAEIEYEDEDTSCTVSGIDPEKDKEVFSTHESLIEGEWLESRDRDLIVLGIQLAGADQEDITFYTRSLKMVHTGDRITVSFTNGLKRQYTVKGIFYTEFIQTDLQAFITETEFRSLSARTKDSAGTVYVRLYNASDADIVMQEVLRIRDDIKVRTWMEYAGIVRSMTDSFSVINAILNIVNLLVAGITVFIVTYIEVTNRRRQIGIQRAIGITPTSISLSYLIRAMFYAVIGAILAILLFIYAITPLEARYPFHFPFGDVYLVIGAGKMVWTGCVILLVTIVASLIPVRSLMRMKIINAIWS